MLRSQEEDAVAQKGQIRSMSSGIVDTHILDKVRYIAAVKKVGPRVMQPALR